MLDSKCVGFEGAVYFDKPKTGEIRCPADPCHDSPMDPSVCWATPEGHFESRRHQKVLRECGICLAGVLSLALVPMVPIVISSFFRPGQFLSFAWLLLNRTQPTPSRDLARLVAAGVCDIARV